MTRHITFKKILTNKDTHSMFMSGPFNQYYGSNGPLINMDFVSLLVNIFLSIRLMQNPDSAFDSSHTGGSDKLPKIIDNLFEK